MIYGSFEGDWGCYRAGVCFHTFGVFFVAVFITKAILFEVCFVATDFLKLPYELSSKLLSRGLHGDDVGFLRKRLTGSIQCLLTNLVFCHACDVNSG